MSRSRHGSIKATGLKLSLVMITAFCFCIVPFYNVNAQIQSSEFAIPESAQAQTKAISNQLRSARYGFVSRHQFSSKWISSIKESISAALCVLDANGDGFQDILTVGGGGFQREFGRKAWWSESSKVTLFLNYQGEYFLPTPFTHPILNDLTILNCASADINNDGFEDLILTHLEGHQILLNQAHEKNKPVNFQTGPALQKQSEFPIHALPVDLNDDGLLDIYSSHFIRYAKGQKTAQAEQGFQVQNDVNFRAALFDSQINSVYLQGADLLQSNQVSFFASSIPSLQSGIGRSIASYSTDIDQDGQNDIAVINSFDSRSRFFLKDDGEFAEASDAFRLLSSDNTLAMTLSDPAFNQDSSQLYLARAAGSSSQLLEYNQLSKSWEIVSNTLTDRRLALQTSEWSVASRDIDFNGYVDYYIGTGLVRPMSDSSHFVTGQANRILLQYPNHRFEQYKVEQDAFLPLSTRGVAFIDVDNNGTAELLSANNNGWFRLQTLSVEPPANWIGFQLPRSAKWQTAQVAVFNDQHQLQQTAVFGNQGFAQSDNRLVFKLPNVSNWQARITNQSGDVVSFTLTKLNRYIGLKENGTTFDIAAGSYRAVEQALLANTPLESGKQLKLLSSRQQNIFINRFINQAELLVPFLNKYWETIHDDSKTRLLSDIAKLPINIRYFILEQVLQFDSGKFVSPILNYLETAEPEYAQFWIEGFVNNLRNNEFCEAMKVLKTLFHEEEAMVLSKQLLIASLILRSDSASKPEMLCLLPVLGEAENQRVSLQLIKQLDSAKDEQIKAAVIKSLGNLRDSRAEERLRKVLSTSNNMELVAESMIALKRMQQLQLTNNEVNYFSRFTDHQVWELLASLVNNPDFGVLLNSDKQVLYKLLESRSARPNSQRESLSYLLAHLLDERLKDNIDPFFASADPGTRILAALISNKHKGTTQGAALRNIVSELNPNQLHLLELIFAGTNLNLNEDLSIQLLENWYEKYDRRSLHALFSYIEGRYVSVFLVQHPSLLTEDLSEHIVFHLNWTLLLNYFNEMQAEQQRSLLTLWYRYCAQVTSNSQVVSCVNKNEEKITSNKIKLYLNLYYSKKNALQISDISLLSSAAQLDWEIVIGIIERNLNTLQSEQVLRMLSEIPASELRDSFQFAEKVASIDKRMLARLATKEGANLEESWYRFERLVNSSKIDEH